jgi:hypothetical protein
LVIGLCKIILYVPANIFRLLPASPMKKNLKNKKNIGVCNLNQINALQTASGD